MASLRIHAPVGAVLALALLAGCGSGGGGGKGNGGGAANAPEPEREAPTSPAEQVQVAGSDALLWGGGDYGVVLAHGLVFDAASWGPQAALIARRGMTALAVEDISPQSILAAAEYLRTERGVKDVALVGGSAGADAILQATAQQQGEADQLILLSANQTVEGLGREPKLFVASEDEPRADVSGALARSAPGERNDVLLLPGDAHAQNIFDSAQGERLTRTLLERLENGRGGPG